VLFRSVRAVAECIAEIKGVPVEDVDAATTRNAVKFYKLELLKAI